jgi:hypothetical protein
MLRRRDPTFAAMLHQAERAGAQVRAEEREEDFRQRWVELVMKYSAEYRLDAEAEAILAALEGLLAGQCEALWR